MKSGEGRSRTIKSSKTQNARRKRNQKILVNIKNRHHQASGNERKILKSIPEEPEKYTGQNYRIGNFSKG